MMGIKRLTVLSGLMAAVLVLAGCGEGKTPAERAQANCNSRVDASLMAEHFVEQRLKSPSTAKFGPYRDMTIAPTGEQCEFLVSSYVDAQNSFGAMMRTNFTAVVRYKPDTNKWQMVSLDM